MDNAKKIELTIKDARGFGDFSENSEYDAAKEEQSKNESRINEIRQILSVATVVEDSGHALTVSIGTTVEIKDEKGKKSTFSIVGTTETNSTNSLEHRISVESPVGKALVGHEKGDKIEVVAPSGKTRKYTITGISR